MGDHFKNKEQILILQPWPEPKAILDRLRRKFPDLEFVYQHYIRPGPEAQVTAETYKHATVLFTLFAFPPTVESAPLLELVQVSSAGVDRAVQSVIYTDTKIPFANASGIHGPQITEWFIMSLLTSGHKYNALYESQKLGKWDRTSGGTVTDLVGQRLGVLGYGSIGRQAARVACSLGMDVIAYTASPRDTLEKRKDYSFIVPGTGDADGLIPSKWFSGTEKADLHAFLGEDIDVLLVAVPLTPTTKGFLSTEEFKILSKKRAFVSNVARGPIIDTDAIKKALEEGLLRGASLDVTDPEPLPEGHELWKAPNLLITPHVSGNTDKYLDRAFQVLEINLDRRAKGEPLINVIDRKKGY